MLFPAACLGCQAEGAYLCDSCQKDAFDVRHSSVNGHTLWSVGPYDGLLKTCIVGVKKRGHKALARELARLAAEAFLEKFPHLEAIQAVMAVPSSEQGQKFRGFSLSQMVEEALFARGGWEPLPADLRRCYRAMSKSSQGMGPSARMARMHGDKLEAHPAAQGKGLLLVDDVVTTGATLFRCLTQAEQHGFGPIYCFALAEHRP